MAALEWRRSRSRVPGVCEGKCRTQAHARGVGIWTATIIGYPAGSWCQLCKQEVARAWARSLEGES